MLSRLRQAKGGRPSESKRGSIASTTVPRWRSCRRVPGSSIGPVPLVARFSSTRAPTWWPRPARPLATYVIRPPAAKMPPLNGRQRTVVVADSRVGSHIGELHAREALRGASLTRGTTPGRVDVQQGDRRKGAVGRRVASRSVLNPEVRRERRRDPTSRALDRSRTAPPREGARLVRACTEHAQEAASYDRWSPAVQRALLAATARCDPQGTRGQVLGFGGGHMGNRRSTCCVHATDHGRVIAVDRDSGLIDLRTSRALEHTASASSSRSRGGRLSSEDEVFTSWSGKSCSVRGQ